MATGSDIVKRALDQFVATVSQDDLRTFSDTTYKDLWEGARQIEQEQGRRLDLRSMTSYGPVIEVFTQGFSPMAFVWVRFSS